MTTDIDPFGITTGPVIDAEAYSKQFSQEVYDTIQAVAEGTDRARQSRQRIVGVSELGGCRRRFQYNLLDTEPSDPKPSLNAAWIGTVLGESLEAQIKDDHPDWLIQETLEFPIPSGGTVLGHSDVIIPASAAGTLEEWEASQQEDYEGPVVWLQGVLDLKSKAELDTIRKYGQSLQQKFQLHAYCKAAIEKGLLDPTKPIMIGNVFFDRSGRNVKPVGIFQVYDEFVVHEIDEWITDVTYAVLHEEDASQDKPIEFCVNWCEFYTKCRGTETVQQGLLEDEDIVKAVGIYADGAAMEKEGKRLKDIAKETLGNVEGSTGEYTIKRVQVADSYIEAHWRKGYSRTDVRKVPKSKKKAAK